MNGPRSAPTTAPAPLPAARWASSRPKSPPAAPHAALAMLQFHKAASFSAAWRQTPSPSPCSTPVPIPQAPGGSRQRRWSASDSLFAAAAADPQLSRTQCEAQLWDDDWHFKLSLEARESFEAAAGDASGPTDSASELSSRDDEPAELFEMDDL